MQYLSSISVIKFPRMFHLTTVFLFAISLVAISCSSSSPEPTEKRLIERSQMANDALNSQNWAAIYQLYQPKIQDICSVSDFESGWNSNYEEQLGALLAFLGSGTELTLVVETNSVAITGTDAYVTLELDVFASDGQSVIENRVNDNAQAWQFINGDWFIAEEIPDEFC